MFKVIDSEVLYKDMNPGSIELYNPWVGNDSQESREQMIATIASISYGNEEAKNPKKLYQRLLDLQHLSCFEFLHTGEFPRFGIQDSLRHMVFDTHNGFTVDDEDMSNMQDNIRAKVACFKIKVPIFVTRQFHRHRAFSFLEISRRYVKDAKVPFEFLTDKDPIEAAFNKTCVAEYNRRISLGQKPEQARGCIPTDVYTTFFAQADVEGLKNFFRLRTDSHAQIQIQEVAWAMAGLIERNQPELYKAISTCLPQS